MNRKRHPPESPTWLMVRMLARCVLGLGLLCGAVLIYILIAGFIRTRLG